ncbi:MAG: AbrB/MazE/SpoVT family DNA-binding domain-containing protein [Desulfobacteraceae bacterium]|jgi:antitoxin VapB|nr:MAG: AbrB/MazE/SpoVT family DNA-binding domain-containing protein [Desulfobacteraceae bacterium]
MQTAKVFKSGNSQAIRLPKDFQFKGTEVFLKKMGNFVVIVPKEDPWKTVEESVRKFTDDIFEGGREQTNPQEREDLHDLYA